jgi:hypothetical protein
MVDFANRDEVKRWLDRLPAKRRRRVAIAMAARAALRVAPFFGFEVGKIKSRPAQHTALQCLRATAVPWAAAAFSAYDQELRDAADAAARAAADAIVARTDGVSRAAAAVATRAAGALADSGAAATAHAADAATRANTAAGVTFAARAAANVAADAAFIDSGRSAAELAGLPLWQSEPPARADHAWRSHKSALLAANEGWEVWTDWYEARLAGDTAHPANEALEIARATIPDEIWKQGPAVVNAEIKRLIAEHPPLTPEADPSALQNQSSFEPILATRAALRVVPLLATDTDRIGDRNKSRFALSVFRALAVAWARTEFPALVDSGWCVAAARDVAAYAEPSALAPRLVGNASAEAAFSAGSESPTVAAARTFGALSRAKEAIAAASSDSSLEIIFEHANTSDRSDIVPGARPDQLGQIELWSGRDPPPAINALWETLKEYLQFAEEGWDVWIDWYESRLDGRMRSQEVELAYVNYIRNVSPSATAWEANSEIRRLIVSTPQSATASFAVTEAPDSVSASVTVSATPSSHSSPPNVPALRSAAIEPIFKSGRLTLPKAAAEATLSGQTIPAALKALAQSLAELAEAAGDESNIDRRIVQRLIEISGSIPRKRPNQTAVFRLGHEYDELKGYSKIVAESWPEFVAARYTAMTLAFERTLRRFPKWVDFTREPSIEKVSAAEAQDISKVAEALSDILRAPESQIIVDAILPDALRDLSMALADGARRNAERPDPIELGYELLAQDVLESVNNTLKRIAEGALAVTSLAGKKAGSYAKEFGEGADESLRKSSRKAGEAVGPAVVKLLKRSLYVGVGVAGGTLSAPTLVTWLTLHYPQMYAWLEPVIAFLK